VHALCSDLAAIFPHLLLQGKKKVGHDYMIEQTFVMSLKRGIFPLETKAQNHTIAISFLPALILQGQEADINNNYILTKIIY
jgi:hypothetical protein